MSRRVQLRDIRHARRVRCLDLLLHRRLLHLLHWSLLEAVLLHLLLLEGSLLLLLLLEHLLILHAAETLDVGVSEALHSPHLLLLLVRECLNAAVGHSLLLSRQLLLLLLLLMMLAHRHNDFLMHDLLPYRFEGL